MNIHGKSSEPYPNMSHHQLAYTFETIVVYFSQLHSLVGHPSILHQMNIYDEV